MTSPKPLTILHLSDLQFGRNHRFGRMGPLAPDDSFETLIGRLQQDLELLQEKQELRPDLLAVTGDLAEWGKKTEFDDVLAFLERLAGSLGLERDRILVIPGNHDINRKACESYFADCEADDEKPREPFWPKFRHYAGFFERFYEGFTPIRFTEAEPWTLFEIQELRVVVAGLNSVMKESHRDADHYGWVGEKQLRGFAEKLREYKERGWMRIALVHHNVLRRAMEDEENLRDVDELVRILGGELNLLLHGHTHEGRLQWLGPRLPVLSTGSASVILEARPKEVPNQYQVIRLFPDRIWHGTRQYAPDQKRWIGDTRSSADGSQWFHEERVAFEHVGETFGPSGAEKQERTDLLATVVASYRNHVATTYRRQLLHDLCTRAEDQEIPGGLVLLDIFIPQAVHAAPPHKDLPRGVVVEEEIGEDVAAPWENGHSPMSVEQALFDPKMPWVFLLGAPGAGKTSLTRWFCLKLCVPGESLPELSSELVPVRVEMRRFDERYRAATVNGRTYDFFDYLDQEHAEKALPLRGESLRALFASGRLIWLFDGMDEVSDVLSRQRYAEMIVGLRNSGSSRGVITSRIVGAQPILPYFQPEGVGIYTLLGFDDTRIQEFITRWHEKAFPGNTEAGTSRRERLERVIAESRPVRDLCKNPLLLTLIALLNRGGELPRRRHLLYRRAVELMAAQWEANKQLPAKVEVLHEPEERIAFLRELAWWMMFELAGGRRNLVREEDLLNFTSRFIVKQYGKSPDQARRLADALIAHLRERSYILARIGERLFGFVHKAFLEYLVAEAVRSRFAGREIELERIEKLFRESWQDDSWQESLTLICGMLDEDRPVNVVRLLQAISPDFDIHSTGNMKFSTFAVRCLAEVRQLDQEPVRTFMFRLTNLVQHEMSNAGLLDFITFASSIHLIGPRWPGRERWTRWATEENHGHPNTRVLANRCALNTTPLDHRGELILRILETERDEFVINQMLIEANPSHEFIETLLKSREEIRCSVAGAITHKFGELNFHFHAFPDELISLAHRELKELLSTSLNPAVRVRAALGLAYREPCPLAVKTLVGYVRQVTQLESQTVHIIYTLGELAHGTPELMCELMSLSQRLNDWDIHEAVADRLIRAGRAAEAIDLILRWHERFPGERPQKYVVNRLASWASTFENVRRSLEHLRVHADKEKSREIADLACVRSCALSKGVGIFMMSLDQTLEQLETAESDPDLFVSRLFRHAIPESKTDKVREVLRGMARAGASPMSRLLAAQAMRDHSLVAGEEWLAILRALVGAGIGELVRLYAARMLGEEGRLVLESLAANATHENVRTMATFSLESLKRRASLQEPIRLPADL